MERGAKLGLTNIPSCVLIKCLLEVILINDTPAFLVNVSFKLMVIVSVISEGSALSIDSYTTEMSVRLE